MPEKIQALNFKKESPDTEYGIVDNDSAFRDDIVVEMRKLRPGKKVVCWHSAEEVLREKLENMPDIIFVDIVLPGKSGIELIAELNTCGFEGKCILLTNMNSDELILEAIEQGAIGYILKSERQELANILDTVESGGGIITPTIALRVLNSIRLKKKTKTDFGLSNRLQEVLDLMVSGKSVPQVAKHLNLSPLTINGYVKDIYKKLNVNNRAQLVGKVLAPEQNSHSSTR